MEMETEPSLESHRKHVIRVVEDVFSTMLGMQVASCPPGELAVKSLTASVHFVGVWKGALLLTCGARQASAFAARLMPIRSGRQEAISDEDVADTLGEIVNMIGGNLKSVLPPGVVLSMPSVVEGPDSALGISGGNEFQSSSFASEAGSFEVTLVRVIA